MQRRDLHAGGPCGQSSASFLWSVEQYPDRRIIGIVLKTVRHTGGAKKHITWRDISHFVHDPISRRAGGDKIDLILAVRDLRPIGRPCGEADLQIAVDEHFRRMAGRSGQCKRGGKRDGGWRLFHDGGPGTADT
jgi:hypothetical protein